VLLPTPTNVNTIHVPGDELLSFIRVQQWVQAECKTALPLVSGAFVLVSSADVPEPPCSRELMDACGYGANSGAFCRAVANCVPWRLRQIEAVEVGPPGQQEPGEAKVLLQGGGCVKASSVSPDTLIEARDYEVSVRLLLLLLLWAGMVDLGAWEEPFVKLGRVSWGDSKGSRVLCATLAEGSMLPSQAAQIIHSTVPALQAVAASCRSLTRAVGERCFRPRAALSPLHHPVLLVLP
jgi:hypothetical protein